jgi:putative transposase
MKLAPQSQRTFFATTVTAERRRIIQSARMVLLLLDVLRVNREKGRFQLHEFVIMPDHLHLMLTPAPDVSIEKAMQFIKGGFSFRAKRELGYQFEVWERSFSERRIKDAEEYERFRNYILENPVRARLVQEPEEYEFSSATRIIVLDSRPPWLKPLQWSASSQG